MSQLFIGGVYKSEEEVARFNRDLAFNREITAARQLTAARRVDQIKAEVLQERKQRELFLQPKRK